jgi:hypothetical protein
MDVAVCVEDRDTALSTDHSDSIEQRRADAEGLERDRRCDRNRRATDSVLDKP